MKKALYIFLFLTCLPGDYHSVRFCQIRIQKQAHFQKIYELGENDKSQVTKKKCFLQSPP